MDLPIPMIAFGSIGLMLMFLPLAVVVWNGERKLKAIGDRTEAMDGPVEE